MASPFSFANGEIVVNIPDADAQKGGVGTITITKWGDPPLSWGT
jgi:hypothetical protein